MSTWRQYQTLSYKFWILIILPQIIWKKKCYGLLMSLINQSQQLSLRITISQLQTPKMRSQGNNQNIQLKEKYSVIIFILLCGKSLVLTFQLFLYIIFLYQFYHHILLYLLCLIFLYSLCYLLLCYVLSCFLTLSSPHELTSSYFPMSTLSSLLEPTLSSLFMPTLLSYSVLGLTLIYLIALILQKFKQALLDEFLHYR